MARSEFPVELSEGAYIARESTIGHNVRIGIGTRIYPWVTIGDDTVIGDYCIVGHPTGREESDTVIGAGSTVRSHTVIYRDVHTGPQFQTGHHALVRDGMRAGFNLRIGSFNDIEGDCTIGDYCRFHGYAHVGRGSRIGSFVWLYGSTVLLNDPLPPSHIESPVVIEDGVVVCTAGIVMPGAVLRKGAFICAGAHAHGDVPAGAVVEGLRGEIVSHVALMADMKSGTGHPWMRHFHNAYPAGAQERIATLCEEIVASRRDFHRRKTH